MALTAHKELLRFQQDWVGRQNDTVTQGLDKLIIYGDQSCICTLDFVASQRPLASFLSKLTSGQLVRLAEVRKRFFPADRIPFREMVDRILKLAATMPPTSPGPPTDSCASAALPAVFISPRFGRPAAALANIPRDLLPPSPPPSPGGITPGHSASPTMRYDPFLGRASPLPLSPLLPPGLPVLSPPMAPRPPSRLSASSSRSPDTPVAWRGSDPSPRLLRHGTTINTNITTNRPSPSSSSPSAAAAAAAAARREPTIIPGARITLPSPGILRSAPAPGISMGALEPLIHPRSLLREDPIQQDAAETDGEVLEAIWPEPDTVHYGALLQPLLQAGVDLTAQQPPPPAAPKPNPRTKARAGCLTHHHAPDPPASPSPFMDASVDSEVDPSSPAVLLRPAVEHPPGSPATTTTATTTTTDLSQSQSRDDDVKQDPDRAFLAVSVRLDEGGLVAGPPVMGHVEVAVTHPINSTAGADEPPVYLAPPLVLRGPQRRPAEAANTMMARPLPLQQRFTTTTTVALLPRPIHPAAAAIQSSSSPPSPASPRTAAAAAPETVVPSPSADAASALVRAASLPALVPVPPVPHAAPLGPDRSAPPPLPPSPTAGGPSPLGASVHEHSVARLRPASPLLVAASPPLAAGPRLEPPSRPLVASPPLGGGVAGTRLEPPRPLVASPPLAAGTRLEPLSPTRLEPLSRPVVASPPLGGGPRLEPPSSQHETSTSASASHDTAPLSASFASAQPTPTAAPSSPSLTTISSLALGPTFEEASGGSHSAGNVTVGSLFENPGGGGGIVPTTLPPLSPPPLSPVPRGEVDDIMAPVPEAEVYALPVCEPLRPLVELTPRPRHRAPGG
ncbi:hypothetical protein PAPYR_11746 [Paratrimastix pyriformis]|uniref:Uncharacterized protein n=2 Tax=Paratrimastix pyriformis TaxID=342808 RepID=A0ABQ8U8N6_9EUKA|nr:hypothetical protein PAPYR_11746 [Paratrimastix pyriformis]